MDIRRALLCATVLGLVSSSAVAQIRNWVNPGTGDWFVAGNWSPSPPVAGQTAVIDNGGTAQISSGSTPALLQASMGHFTGTNGRLEMLGGQLNTTTFVFVGNGGTGYLLVDDPATVISTPHLYLANSPSANGTMVFNSGTINAGMTVGGGGTGTLTQQGGVITSSTNIHMGVGAAGNGTWQMNGGQVNVLSGTLNLGSSGTALFEQNAGTQVNLLGLVVGSNGTYELHGGEFAATQVNRSSSGSPVFTMDGGRLDVGQFGSPSVHFSLTVDGGIVGPWGTALPNQMVLFGNYTQNAAGIFEVKAIGPGLFSYDRILMIGQPTLNDGILDFTLAYTPSIGDQFLILKNDAAVPVVGNFAGLPEGALYWEGAHLLQITYAGWDGNDVVLTVVEPTCVEPPPDMTAWWPLDELVGPVSEDLVNDNDGATTGGPIPTVGEYVHNSYCFSGGSAQYVEVPHAPEIDFGTTDFSIDAWVKTTTTTGVRVIVEKRISSGGVTGYSMYLANGTLGFQLADGSGSTSCSCSPTASCTNYSAGGGGFVADGQWHHVAVTVDRVGGGGTFYVDGASVATFDPMCRPDPYANTGPLRIGYVSLASGSNFEGCIDEVELFNRALTAPEVSSLYVAKELGKCKCDCPADVNGDEFIDGLDVAAFTRCILLSSMAGDHCSCADMNTDETVDLVDIPLFTDELLGGGPCP